MESVHLEHEVLNSFQTWRGWVIEVLNKVDVEIVDMIPAGCNNSIRWHAGHLAVAWDQGIFQNVFKEKHLPEHYVGYFANGTSPSQWNGDAPALAEIITHLEAQRHMIGERIVGNWDLDLVNPFLQFTKASQMFFFLLSHEAMHFGQIRSFIKTLEASQPNPI